MNIQSFLDNAIFLSLLLVTIISWASVIYSKFKPLQNSSFYGLIATNFLIFFLLALRWIQFGYFPLSNLYESLMFLAWGITFVSIVTREQSNISIVASLSSPIALFVCGFASLSLPETMQAPSPLVPALKSNWLMMHVTVMMLSYASLIIGSLLSIFFLALSWGNNEQIELQGNSLGKAFFRPSVQMSATLDAGINEYSITDSSKINRLSLLESIDNLSYRTISFGFPLLTIGIIAGAVWANEAWGSYWSWDPKETWALITWLVFASYLHARITKTWQGKKPAIIAAVGFVVVWICYLGVNFLGKGLHTYGQML
uniref:CcsA n=1 Tax=Ochrosphaera neapolitana TaxID=35137 RepID=UPI00286ADE5F|nr:CcsA [Ochrosphaera neapolitana]WKK50083.1 CcsA [Ochrosphaera neapolitana]